MGERWIDWLSGPSRIVSCREINVSGRRHRRTYAPSRFRPCAKAQRDARRHHGRGFEPGLPISGRADRAHQPASGHLQTAAMRYLLSIKTVFPKPGNRVWYDDQREVHRQLFEAEETVDYAFTGTNPEAADNRALREAYEQRIPILYFLGIAPGRYQVMMPAFIARWDGPGLRPRWRLASLTLVCWVRQLMGRSGAMRCGWCSNGCIKLHFDRPC